MRINLSEIKTVYERNYSDKTIYDYIKKNFPHEAKKFKLCPIQVNAMGTNNFIELTKRTNTPVNELDFFNYLLGTGHITLTKKCKEILSDLDISIEDLLNAICDLAPFMNNTASNIIVSKFKTDASEFIDYNAFIFSDAKTRNVYKIITKSGLLFDIKCNNVYRQPREKEKTLFSSCNERDNTHTCVFKQGVLNYFSELFKFSNSKYPLSFYNDFLPKEEKLLVKNGLVIFPRPNRYIIMDISSVLGDYLIAYSIFSNGDTYNVKVAGGHLNRLPHDTIFELDDSVYERIFSISRGGNLQYSGLEVFENRDEANKILHSVVSKFIEDNVTIPNDFYHPRVLQPMYRGNNDTTCLRIGGYSYNLDNKNIKHMFLRSCKEEFRRIHDEVTKLLTTDYKDVLFQKSDIELDDSFITNYLRTARDLSSSDKTAKIKDVITMFPLSVKIKLVMEYNPSIVKKFDNSDVKKALNNFKNMIA